MKHSTLQNLGEAAIEAMARLLKCQAEAAPAHDEARWNCRNDIGDKLTRLVIEFERVNDRQYHDEQPIAA